jgi:chromosome segregation ATPase
VRALQERQRSTGEAETVALPSEEVVPAPAADESSQVGGKADTPSETSERLSEGVGALRDKAEEILEELDRLEARLEAAEVEQLALRETASRERARAEKLQAELDAARSGGRPQHERSWRRLFGG